MSSVKAKLAALRAKRAKQRSAATPLADPELSAAALAVGAPQVSWDADYKAKLRQVDTTSTLKDSEGSFCLSGEDDDELVVLPPPTRKLNPAAQRQLWRKRELERAKEKAAKTLLEIRPESFDVDDVPMEPCSEDPGTLEDGKVGEREEGGNLSDRDEDEDEVPPNQPGSGYLGAENGVEQDEEEAALKTAQLEEEEEYEDAMDDLPLATPEDVLENNTPCVVTNKCDAPENGARASEQAEQDASRHATEAKETTNDTASTEDQVAPEAPQETNQSTMEATSDTRQINVPGEKKLRKGSWFIGWKKSPEVKAPERRFKTGFVEEEAHDDDGDGQDDCGGGAASNDDADNDEDECDELAEKENINPSENKKLSAFHQKWILDKEKGELEAMKTVPGRMMVNVVDEAMDLTELRSKPDTETKKEEPLEEEEHLSEADVGTCEVGGVPEKIQHGSGDYVDAMFLRDDSRSRNLEGDEQEKEESGDEKTAKRDKARALWKARQKSKTSLFLEDENSLSRFDIFGDADKSRSTHFREKLESACRPASLKDIDDRSKSGRDQNNTGKKRSSPWALDASVPEWERRNASMQQRQRKRQRSVSVGKWSFATRSGKDKPHTKTARSVSSGTGGSSLGSTYQALKPRVNSVMPKRSSTTNRVGRVPQRRPTKAPTTVRGLLKVLGGRAETDM